jgi:CHASE2 domain-containing sensor protein
MLSRRLLLHTLLEAGLTGIAYVALHYGLLLPGQAPVAVAVGILFIALEWVSAFISCRRVFNGSVHRQGI